MSHTMIFLVILLILSHPLSAEESHALGIEKRPGVSTATNTLRPSLIQQASEMKFPLMDDYDTVALRSSSAAQSNSNFPASRNTWVVIGVIVAFVVVIIVANVFAGA